MLHLVTLVARVVVLITEAGITTITEETSIEAAVWATRTIATSRLLVVTWEATWEAMAHKLR